MAPAHREELDRLLRSYLSIEALTFLMNAVFPRPRLVEAQELAACRRKVLGLSEREPTPAPELEAVWEKLAAMFPRPLAIEALWDGDTYGWRLSLAAVLPDFSGADRYSTHHLAVCPNGAGDWRLFNGTVPPWPEATLATAMGEELARRLGVPFFFASPDSPDDDAPRWWDARS